MVLNFLPVAFYAAAYYLLSLVLRILLEVIEVDSVQPLSDTEWVAFRTNVYRHLTGDSRVIDNTIGIYEDVILLFRLLYDITANLQSLISSVWFYLRLHAAFLLINICCAVFISRTRRLLVLLNIFVHVD